METRIDFIFEVHLPLKELFDWKYEHMKGADIAHVEFKEEELRMDAGRVELTFVPGTAERIKSRMMYRDLFQRLYDGGVALEATDHRGASEEDKAKLKEAYERRRMEEARRDKLLGTAWQITSTLRDLIYVKDFMARYDKLEGKKVVGLFGNAHTLRYDLLKGLLRGKCEMSECYVEDEVGLTHNRYGIEGSLAGLVHKYKLGGKYGEGMDNILQKEKARMEEIERRRVRWAEESIKKGRDGIDAFSYSRYRISADDLLPPKEIINDIFEKRKRLQNGIGLEEFLSRELIKSWV